MLRQNIVLNLQSDIDADAPPWYDENVDAEFVDSSLVFKDNWQRCKLL